MRIAIKKELQKDRKINANEDYKPEEIVTELG